MEVLNFYITEAVHTISKWFNRNPLWRTPGPTSSYQMRIPGFREIKWLSSYRQNHISRHLRHHGSSLSFPVASLLSEVQPLWRSLLLLLVRSHPGWASGLLSAQAPHCHWNLPLSQGTFTLILSFLRVINQRCDNPFGKISHPWRNHIVGQIMRNSSLHMWKMGPRGSAANIIHRTNIYGTPSARSLENP